MVRVRRVVLLTFAMLAMSAALHAQDITRYRDFTLGSSVASVIKVTRLPVSDVKLIHQRPAMIQELRWPLALRFMTGTAQPEAVRDMVFRFYNDQLFQIIVTYERHQVEGLTDADLVASMTTIYGAPLIEATRVAVKAAPATLRDDDETVIARWAGPESSLSLHRVRYPTAVRLTLVLTPIEALATAAAADAVARDAQEAPQRERDRQSRDVETRRLAGEKARIANKVTFKP